MIEVVVAAIGALLLLVAGTSRRRVPVPVRVNRPKH